MNIRRKLYRLKRRVILSIISLRSWPDKLPYYLGLKKADSGSMPDFLIAGLPKCGTWWLVHALKENQHFEFVSNPFTDTKGETRFFSFNFNQPITKYLNAFKARRTNEDKLLFEKSPDYSTMSLWRIRLIKRLNPSIKIILIFRDPVKRCFSNTKMDLMRKRGLELKPEYDDLFFGSYKSQIKKYNYQKILKNWFSVFDKSQILVLSMEDIKNKPHEVIEKTCHFLGKPYVESTLDLSKAKNTTVSVPIPSHHLAYLEKELQNDIAYWNANQEMFRI